MELFKDIVSQYIDDNGKTRLLTYRSGVCLMTSPLPPFDVPIDKDVKTVSLDKAEKFIRKRGLEITMQDGNIDDGLIRGFWVKSIKSSNSGIYYGYIPIEVSNAVKSVDFVLPTLIDPLRTDGTSELESMHRSRKIAEFLKQYVMYQYSLDPEGFSEDSFAIIPDHEYDISLLNKRLYTEDNDIMYTDDGRLIVPSEDIRDRLISFLKIRLLNDTPGVMDYKDRSVIKDYYQTLSDFSKTPGQLIFLTKDSLARWKHKALRETSGPQNEITTNIHPHQREPYFYRNYNISSGRLVLIQNVKNGDLDKALSVGEKWAKDRINPGYYAKISKAPSRVTYTVYTEERGKVSTTKGSSKGKHVNVLEYFDGNYAAILLL